MTKQEKIKDIENQILTLKKEINYYDSLQQGLKLVLNGSYGAFAAQWFILFSNHVASSITAAGRELTRTMSEKNEDYWYNKWHLDTDLHKKLYINNVEEIEDGTTVSVYGDTDSIFVGFEPALDSCDWKNNIFNERWLNKCPYPFRVLSTSENFHIDINNPNYKGYISLDDEHKLEIDGEVITDIPQDFKLLLIDGDLLKNRYLHSLIEKFKGKIMYNWSNELSFIHALDFFRIGDYFKEELILHANKFGVENLEDFELEKIAESVINLEKKKYIQHISWEDGIDYERFSYYQPKGVELVRSSTPVFARDKELGIYRIIKYLFSNPKDFNIQDLTKIVKEMRKEFELADINDISGQSSCSKYNEKIIDDKKSLRYLTGTHFGVKAAGLHNYLLNQHSELQTKYGFIKSGDKIKYYYTKNPVNPIFGFKRGDYPIEFAPPVDYDVQFAKVILSPINGIIKKIGLPEINQRLSVLTDIFAGL